jgi:type I restriction enzyme M protein
MLNDVNGLGLKLWRLCLESDFQGELFEFKNYFLALFSYKFLSERLVFKLDYELREDNLSFVEAYNLEEYRDALRDEALESLGFFIEPDFLFSNFVRLACIGDVNLLRKLEAAFKMFSDCSYYGVCPLSFMNLFEDVDLQSDTLGKTEDDRTDFISELLIHLSFFDFQISNEDDCIVGDVFDYLLSQFAFESNSIGCYAPLDVNMVLSKIVSLNKHVLDSVYDSCSGLSSSLLSVKREVLVNNFYGEEINQTYFNIARMNMLIHNVKCEDFNLVCGDCLEHPGFEGVKFDAIVSNLICYSHWSGDRKFLNDERFKDYGRVPPKTLSNFALLLHMLYYLKDDGTMAYSNGYWFSV